MSTGPRSTGRQAPSEMGWHAKFPAARMGGRQAVSAIRRTASDARRHGQPVAPVFAAAGRPARGESLSVVVIHSVLGHPDMGSLPTRLNRAGSISHREQQGL